MRTIKTYFKGAPFYIASSYRHVGFSAGYDVGHIPIVPASCRDLSQKGDATIEKSCLLTWRGNG